MSNPPTNCRLLFICSRFFYAGQIEYANQKIIRLSDAELVLDTGPMTRPYWNEADWLDTVEIPRSSIESWLVTDKRVRPDEFKNDLRRTDMSVIGRSKRSQSYQTIHDWAAAGGWGG